MIWFFIIFIIVNIISYKTFIENSCYADGSDIFLYLLCSIFGTFIIFTSSEANSVIDSSLLYLVQASTDIFPPPKLILFSSLIYI